MSYTYARWNEETHKYDTITLPAGEGGLTQDIILFLDEMDHDGDLNDRYENEHKDPGFEAKRDRYEADPDDDDAVDPWDEIEDRNADLPDDCERQETPENPDAAKIREVVETDFTPEQQDLFYSHFGECKQMEQIRQEEVELLTITSCRMNRQTKH